LISYAIRDQATLMNNWEDPSYFTGAFPTLFPTGIGGHLDQRPKAVSLKAFAQWALNHHSRRFNISVKYYKTLLTYAGLLATRSLCTSYTMYCKYASRL
jgi:hypothetical protein